jgi:hypothetical protein
MPYKHQDLLTSTYFDDFDATKNFLQVLFKPGYAVQARELTQLQTILQNQISKVGDHLFLDGTHVYGAKISTGYYYYFARIANVKYVGQTENIPTASQVASMFKNKSFCPVKFKSKSGTAYDTTSATDRSAIANLDPDIDIIIEVVDVLEPTTNDGYILIFKFNYRKL